VPKTAGLRTEVLTTLTLLMGAALLLGGVMLLRLTGQSLLEQKVEQLRLMTGTIARALADSYRGTEQKTPFVLTTLRQLPEEQHHEGWWVYGPDLQLIASFRSGEVEPYPAIRRQQVRLSGQPLESVEFPSLLQTFTAAEASAHFVQPLYQQKRFIGLLEICYSLEDIRYRLLLSQRMILLYVLLYGCVLVFIGYYLLQRNVIRPARNLLQATEDVSRGHLETRLPAAGPTEIVRLADAFNHMVAALQESRRETQVHISTLEQTNQELQRTRDELIRSEKLASVGQLAAGLAHELGNPLAALIGYLEILKGRLQDDDREVVRRSITEAARIDYLVRELLNFSRPTDIEAQELDPVTVLRSAVSLLEHQGAFVGIKLIDRLPAALDKTRISDHKLQQLFVNLLLNAAQACRAGGQVELVAGQSGETLWLTITDNGCGIKPEQLGKIFDPFFSTKPPGKGTGLGLSICHRIVEEVGGRIEVVSQAGEGSCFKVELSRFSG